MTGFDLVSRIGESEALDRIGNPLGKLASRIPKGAVKDALSGTWLGHPLHPLLTDVVIGAFTSASVLDVVGGSGGGPAAQTLVGLGLAATVPTVAAGLSDWSDTYGHDKRVGVAHAASNATGAALQVLSLRARRRGHRGRGAFLSLLGLGAMTVGGYLGGYLSYGRGIGVNNAFWQEPPQDWTPVLDESAVVEDRPTKVSANGATVLLYRHGGRIQAIGSRCTHAGGPLEEGEVDGEAGCVTCPWHASVFRLDDGSVVHGPATIAEPAYDVRVEGGKVEVRVRP
jgi:nitrite reductase/ring-hydroxylating ferredoxin subunit/uncharacterized membrane protein